MHEVLVNRLGSLSLPRKSVVRLTDCPDMTLDVYRRRKTTIQQQQQVVILGRRKPILQQNKYGMPDPQSRNGMNKAYPAESLATRGTVLKNDYAVQY